MPSLIKGTGHFSSSTLLHSAYFTIHTGWFQQFLQASFHTLVLWASTMLLVILAYQPNVVGQLSILS
jgi:hypothetical protein